MIRIVVGFVLLLLVGYGAVKAVPLLSGPSLVIATPSNYTTSADGFMTVSGVARNTEALFLNGGPLLIDPDGRFSKELLLPSGGAILTFTARDRFGRSSTETRTVYTP
ncbi:MAG TPA: hypothetical protein VEB18_00625 [Candidatus Paceibacterota bacterium]|nr:hypothetical protein [Candidatus Paceibacterota bacterium]